MPGQNNGVCQYLCYDGDWTLVYSDPAPGYYCPDIAGGCTVPGDDSTFLPPLPEQNIVGGATRRSAPPKNAAEYIYVKGAKSIRMLRGSCKKGKYLLPEIKLTKLATLAPSVYELIKSIKANKSVTSIIVVVPAQPLKKS